MIKQTINITACAVLLAIATGCSSGKAGLKVSGPFKSDVHGDYNDLCARMGHDPKSIGKGKKIKVVIVEPEGDRGAGPYRCGGMQGDNFSGCWLGINYPGDTIYMPDGFARWVLRHEVYHSVLRHMRSKGIPAVVEGTERTPGHWMQVRHKDGRIVSAQSIVQTRWPARTLETIQALVPGGMTPQEAWAGESNDWADVICVAPDWMIAD